MEQNKEMNIHISDEIARGSYANLAMITHSTSEFIIDFISMMPGIKNPEVRNRIIMTPEHAKRFMQALQDNIAKYESMFGPIKLPRPEVPHIPFNSGNTPQA